MEFDTRIEDLLREILHFLEFSLKDVLFPASILEEKFRLSGQVARVLQKKNVWSSTDKLKAFTDGPTYVSMESPTSLFLAEEETILRSGHKHRNGMVLDQQVSEMNRSGSEPRSDSGCPDTVSQFSDETLDSKRVSLSSTSSGESTATRREDDATSIRSSISNVQLSSSCDGPLPTYEEAESRAFFVGAIKKKFGIVPGWKTYAGVVCDGKLLLYCSSKTGAPKLVIVLDSYEVRAASVSKKKNNFEFVIVGAGKQTYKFRTETEDDLSSWVRSLESAVRSISIGGVTEDETSDLPAETKLQEDRTDRLSAVDNLFSETIKFDLLADMKKLEEYEIMKKAERGKSLEPQEVEVERNSIIFETRDLPSIPSEEFYDDVVTHEQDENIYDMPSKGRKEEIYDVPVNLDASRRSSSGTVYDSPEELVYDAPNISFDPSELYDVPKFCYDPPAPTVETAPPLTAKKRSAKRSESLNEACYNIPRNIYESDVYDQPKPVVPKLCDKVKSEKEMVEVKKIESKTEVKSKIPRQFSFSGGPTLFKDELELKLKKQRDNDPTEKSKKDFMNKLLDESPEEGRFFAYPAIVEPVSPVTPQPRKLVNPPSSKQISPLADVFTNARNVFLQKAEQIKKTPPKLKLDFDSIPPSARLSPGEPKKSAPPTPTKVVPPRPPAPAFREDLKENSKKEKSPPPGRTPPPPLISPLEEIYEDIDQGEYAEPEVYIARWAYIAAAENELNLRKAEIVYVINKTNKDLWLCKTSKSQGYVPSAYLAKVS